MATLVVVDPSLKPQPIFNSYPFVAMVNDKE